MKEAKDKKPLADYRHYLLKAIQQCDNSQKELGIRSKLGEGKINYLLNRGKKISYEDATAIAQATQGAVSRFQLADHLNLEQKRQYMAECGSLGPIPMSEWIKLGQAHEEALRRQPLGTVKGRIETLAAEIAHLHNYQTYRQAKQILQWGVPELIEALDQGRFKIFTLSQIARYTPEQQRYLLGLSHHREIKAWMSRQPPLPKPSNARQKSRRRDSPPSVSIPATVKLSSAIGLAHAASPAAVCDQIEQMLADRRLYQAERRSGWPLRLLCLSLACLADKRGRLEISLELLRRLLPNDRCEKSAAIQTLIALGWIQPVSEESSA